MISCLGVSKSEAKCDSIPDKDGACSKPDAR